MKKEDGNIEDMRVVIIPSQIFEYEFGRMRWVVVWDVLIE